MNVAGRLVETLGRLFAGVSASQLDRALPSLQQELERTRVRPPY